MSRMENGDELDLLTGLGNGYDTEASGDSPAACRRWRRRSADVYALRGSLYQRAKMSRRCSASTAKDDVFYENEFRALGADVHIATADGTYGHKGLCHGRDERTCNTHSSTPADREPMFRAVHKIMKTPRANSASKSAWAAASARAWAAHARRLTGNEADLQRGPRNGKGGDNMGRHERKALRR